MFEQILMDDTVYACLSNKYLIDGDVDCCLYSFFQQHPDFNVQLEQASKQVLLQSQQTVDDHVGPPLTLRIRGIHQQLTVISHSFHPEWCTHRPE